MKLNSNTETISATPEKLYNILINFTKNNQVPILPQVSNWQNLEDGCSFTVMNMINCSMRLTGQTPYQHVQYTISTDKNINANAAFFIEDLGTSSNLHIAVEADVPIFLQPMIKTPLEHSLNNGLHKIKELAERI